MKRPVSGEPVKEIRRTRASTDQGCPDLVAESLDEVEDARGEAGLVDEVHQQRTAERRPLGRLQDDGVARGEGRRALPRREHERRVPGRDDDGRARGHAQHRVARCRWRPSDAVRSREPARRRPGSCARPDRSLAAAGSPRASPCRGTRRGRCASTSRVDEVGQAIEVGAAFVERSARPTPGTPSAAARDREVGLDRAGRVRRRPTSSVQSSGERSSKVRADAMRSPLM